jgi:hypothetical protein
MSLLLSVTSSILAVLEYLQKPIVDSEKLTFVLAECVERFQESSSCSMVSRLALSNIDSADI